MTSSRYCENVGVRLSCYYCERELVNNICKRWGLFQTCLHNEVGKVKQGYLEVNYLCQVFKVVSMKLHHNRIEAQS